MRSRLRSSLRAAYLPLPEEFTLPLTCSEKASRGAATMVGEVSQSLFSIGFVLALLVLAASAPLVLRLGPLSPQRRLLFLWLVFDAFIHILCAYDVRA